MNTINNASVTLFILMTGIAVFPTLYTLITGDFPGVDMFYGLEEDSAVVDVVLTVSEWMRMKF